MSTAMYEITNEKSDFEKGYLDLELHMVNAKEPKVIDASMLVMPEDTKEDGFITNCCKVVAFSLLVAFLYILAVAAFIGLANFGYNLYFYLFQLGDCLEEQNDAVKKL